MFLPKTKILPKIILLPKTKKIQNLKFCLRQKNLGLASNFLLFVLVGWVSNPMKLIGNFRVIKGLTQVIICYISLPRGNLSNYFMIIIVFSKLYRSKSAVLEIAYDMKNRFLAVYYLFLSQTVECKNILYVHLNRLWSNPKWMCLNWNTI